MSDLISLAPTLLLVVMVTLTLVLLPQLGDDRPPAEDRQTTDRIRTPRP